MFTHTAILNHLGHTATLIGPRWLAKRRLPALSRAHGTRFIVLNNARGVCVATYSRMH